MNLDVLAFGAHPDDTELCVGGTLIKLKSLGYRTGIVDLTQGEMGSRGDSPTRLREAAKAAEILGVDLRQTLDLGDGHLDEDLFKKRPPITTLIRQFKPTLILAPSKEDRHPDHAAAGRLVERACFDARLTKLDLGYPIHAPKATLYYLLHDYVEPTLVVDISDVFTQKMEAIKAYESQFCVPVKDNEHPPIGISDYIFHVESRSRFYGSLINVEHGEAFYLRVPLRIKDLVALFEGEKSLGCCSSGSEAF
ncbi:TPA: bacillithiol biosynthesis deacetylase BshB1 [bacterium]|nr:bacillithiol biosynthesis deacetylase BshB1 [bacterium]